MDLADYLRFVVALLFVLGLIGLLAWLVRRYRPGGALRPDGRRRLTVLETLPLDPRRRLVLVRRDDALHLLLLGEDGNRLIESLSAGVAPPAAEDTGPGTADEVVTGGAA
jgi:flagellar protein FliO/FliZ